MKGRRPLARGQLRDACSLEAIERGLVGGVVAAVPSRVPDGRSWDMTAPAVAPSAMMTTATKTTISGGRVTDPSTSGSGH